MIKTSDLRKLLTPETLVVGAIMILAVFLRFYNLGSHIQFTYDQGRDFLVLEAMSGGDLKLVGPTTGIDGFFVGPFMYYLLWPAFWISGGSPYWVAAWNALLITSALPFFYLLLKKQVGAKQALLGLLLLCLCVGSIEDAKLIWNPSLTAATLIISTWALFKSLDKPKYLFLSLFFYGLSLQTEFAYTFFLFPLYLWWLTVHGRHYSSRLILWGSGAFGLTLVPQLIFELKHKFIMTRSLIQSFLVSSDAVSYLEIWSKRPDHIFSEFKAFLFADQAYAPWFTLFLTLLIFFYYFKRKKTPAEKFLQAMFVAPLVGFLLFKGNQGNFFSHYVSPHYFSFLAILILTLAWLPYKRYLATLIILMFVRVYFDYWPLIFNPTLLNLTVSNQIQALRFVRNQTQLDTTSVEFFTPNLSPDQYRYLNLWLNKQKGLKQVVEGNQDFNEFFLVYEPGVDTGSQFAFEAWYERIQQGSNCQMLDVFGTTRVKKCLKSK